MGNHLKTKYLTQLGYTNNQLRSLVVNIFTRHFKHSGVEEQWDLLARIKEEPEAFIADPLTSKIAMAFTAKPQAKKLAYDLLEEHAPLKVYGGKEIEEQALKQMKLATSLPVSVQAALLPDAHSGYGLPIGGVLATENVVIPYGVGMDIGCRMALSILDAGELYLKRYDYKLKQALRDFTHFGMEGGLAFRQEHEVLDSPLFKTSSLLKPLHAKAVRQLGSSGSGNHFVEFGEISLHGENSLGLEPKKYLALLSHSGSRGLGAAITMHFTKIAMDTCKLPRQAQQLAWLDLQTEAGQAYWQHMNFAGEYAQACHDRIHANLLRSLGLETLARVENHHNFAWKDTLPDGREVIIHRKGATPAHAGELGIIPGSMCTPAYLVRGSGRHSSLFSASHGAGRAMSRQKAKNSMTPSALKKMLLKAGVELIGGSVEENPSAYKDIDNVMRAQRDLVTIEGSFQPRLVRMNKE
ncbi:RtcB family protein [Pedobacter sp. SYSU D00535]|uniref:RtcB family protein n=1 Tax=Pedobacter sp. SYSU D00535 TaxID=2810308 RepID=UPI001A96EF44|nr:RtcB family protein [Pedobacter sp. SYSU D00535]